MRGKATAKHCDDSVVNLRLSSADEKRDLSDWIRYIQLLHYRTMDLTLDRVGTVIGRIRGSAFPFRIISIAGTNGKGSLATMLESVFRHAGLSTGLYTSPHLVDFNERVIVDGKLITDADLLEEFQRVEALRGDVPLTFFEYGTAIAVDYFIRRAVDVAIFEVGLGGRKDAVNVMDADIACITSIGTDHERWLGNTREQIGFEKAGILRANQLAVCTDTDLPASVRKVAQELSVKLHVYTEDFQVKSGSNKFWSLQFNSFDSQFELYDIPEPPIHGQCQQANAAGAVAAALLARRFFDVPDAAIRAGMQATRLNGRLQVIQKFPQVLVDVAHNIESVRELERHLALNPVVGKNIALMSVLSEKPIELMVESIKHVIDEWHICGIHDERGATARQLHRRIQPILGDTAGIELHYDVKQGFNSVVPRTQKTDRVVVFGSFLTVGEVIQEIRNKAVKTA